MMERMDGLAQELAELKGSKDQAEESLSSASSGFLKVEKKEDKTM